MNRQSIMRTVSLIALAAAAIVPSVAFGGTLGKITKAVAYPIRKTGQNASVDTHRALGHNSVVRRHHGYRHHNAVVTPGGHVKPVNHM